MKYVRIFLYILLAFANAVWMGISGARALMSGFEASNNIEQGVWLVGLYWVSFIAHLCMMFIAWGYRKTLSAWVLFALLLSPVVFFWVWKLANSYYQAQITA